MFALLVLATFALHKLVMESRIKSLESMITGVQQEKAALQYKFKKMDEKYDELLEIFDEQDLYSTKHFPRKRV